VTTRARALLSILALSAAALPGDVVAHQAGISYGEYRLEGGRLEVTLRISAAELAAAFPEPTSPSEQLPAGATGALARAVLATVAAERSGACALESAGASPDAPDGVRFRAVLRCPGEAGPVAVRPGFVARLAPGHVHLARAIAGGEVREQVVDARTAVLAVEPGGAGWPSRVARFVALGIEHIFTGWDHLAFLAALLLGGGTLGAAVKVATSFTVGHAITLALATLGLVRITPSVVEPLIAASVAFVAAENLWDLGRGRAGKGRRWPVALGFGLVHGFGFAGALVELGLPREGLATALVGFNLGVELGQAAVVALLVPLLALGARQPERARCAVRLGSTALCGAGLFWLVERLPW
jgi:HupE / UreJ protein